MAVLAGQRVLVSVCGSDPPNARHITLFFIICYFLIKSKLACIGMLVTCLSEHMQV